MWLTRRAFVFSGGRIAAAVLATAAGAQTWTGVEIGATAAPGNATQSGSTFVVSGSGAGIGRIWYVDPGERGSPGFSYAGARDAFRFHAVAATGNVEITARFASLSGPSSTHAGIMLRESTADHARNVAIHYGTDGKFVVTARGLNPHYGETRIVYAPPEASPPRWLRLARIGRGVMSSASFDGVTWTDLVWVSLPLNDELLVGLAAASGDDTLASATFEQVRVGPTNRVLPAPAVPIGLHVVRNGFDAVRFASDNALVALAWDRTPNADVYEVERWTEGEPAVLGTTSETGFEDKRLRARTTYRFRVRAIWGTTPSEFSAPITVTTGDYPTPPADLVANAVSAASAHLSWQRTSDDFEREHVEVSTDGVTFEFIGATLATSSPAMEIPGLEPDRTYYFRVRAVPSDETTTSNVAQVTMPLPPTGRPVITEQPVSLAMIAGNYVRMRTGTTSAGATFQWQRNGVDIAQTSSDFYVHVVPPNVGIYSAIVTDSAGFSFTSPGVVALLTSQKVEGTGRELGPNILHPNGNVYDQVLLEGVAASITADPGQVVRLSYLDLQGDIVQVEFSGAGTLTIGLENLSGPGPAELYRQPGISYVRGHATLVVGGADETTHLTVFSVGRNTAVNQSLFREDVDYDGWADIASVAILSADGRFGGLRLGNTAFSGTHGQVGIYAPDVEFTGPVVLHDITAADSAVPVLRLRAASSSGVTIAGGTMAQTNGRAVQVSGFERLQFTAGASSHGEAIPAQSNAGRYEENGADVTARVAP